MEGIDVQPTTVDRVSGVDGRPVPFTGQRDAVDHRFDDRTGRLIGERRVRPEVLQIGRQIEVDGAVDVGQVDLEQHVPHFVVAAVLVEAVPPVPVAALGDVERFPREVKTRIVRVVGLEGDQRPARLDEALPRQTLVGFTGPGAERPVDPRPRSDRFDAWQVRVVREELTGRGRDHGGVGREPRVPLVNEGAGVVVVLEFGHEHPVLTVHCDGQQVLGRVFARFKQFSANAVEVGQEIRNRRLGRHGTVLEGHAIRDDPVAEDDRDVTTLVARDHPRRGQQRSVFDVDAPAAWRRGLGQDFLVGDHPLHADVGHGLHHRGRNRLFGGPHPRRSEAKFCFEQVHAGAQVATDVDRPRVLVDANPVLEGPTGHHQQGHDGVVVGRRGQLDLARRRQLAVHGQHVRHVRMLLVDDVGQVGRRVVPALGEEVHQPCIGLHRGAVSCRVVKEGGIFALHVIG